MRVLMVTQFYAPTIGGQERIVEDLCVELISRGHDVALATLQQEGLPASGDLSGVRVHRIASTVGRFYRGYVDPSRRHAPPAVDPRAAAELRRVVELERPEIVHGHDWLIHSFLPLKRRHGPGLVVTLHDHSLVCANKRLIRRGEACTGPGPAKCLRCSGSYYGLLKGPAIAGSNWLMSATERALVDMFLPVSRAVANGVGLQDHGDQYQVIPNFIPDSKTAMSAHEHRLAGLPREFVFFAGDVSRDKGVAVLLEAHMALNDPPPLVLMGRLIDPHLLVPAVGSVRALNPGLLAAPVGRVRAVGAHPHEYVLDALRRCTVAVVPSLMPEAFGLFALEAMSAGRPVIASNVGGLRDIITDGEDGILVPPGDADALQAGLARALDDPALRARIGAAAERRAEDFTADRIVPQVEQVYEFVLATRRRRFAGHAPPASAAGARLSARVGRIWRGLHRPAPIVILALAAVGLVATNIPAGTWSPLRAILVLPLVLLLPGYALTDAIFRLRAPAWPERVVLALSFSLVVTAFASLVLYLTPFELTLHSWAASLALVTTAAVIVGAARPSTAPGKPPRVPRRLSLRRRRVEIAVSVVAVGFVAAAVALARTPLPSPSAPGYTALWLTKGRHSATLMVGVRSEEHQTTRYVLRLALPGHTTSRRLVLAPGQTWQETLPPARQAAASLYRAGHRGVYRFVRLRAPTSTGR